MNLGAREEWRNAQLRYLDFVNWRDRAFAPEMLEALQVGLGFTTNRGEALRVLGVP
jgi:hypothetical protein